MLCLRNVYEFVYVSERISREIIIYYVDFDLDLFRYGVILPWCLKPDDQKGFLNEITPIAFLNNEILIHSEYT